MPRTHKAHIFSGHATEYLTYNRASFTLPLHGSITLLVAGSALAVWGTAV